MIGIDTNVLVRHLVRDDAEQAAHASAFLEGRLTRERPGFVNRIVLVELVWVLESCYGVARAGVADIVDRLLGTAELLVEDGDDVREAVRRFRGSGADLADQLIAVGNRRNGCTETCTFARKAAMSEGFVGL